MEPLDPKLARLVHDGMVQAVPGPELEDRVLRGLLARLPDGGPTGGDGEGGGAPIAAKAGAAAGGKAWVLGAVLGATAVTGGLVLGGRREPERQGVVVSDRVREGSAASTKRGPAVSPKPAADTTSTNAGGSGTSTSFVQTDGTSRSSPTRSASTSANDRDRNRDRSSESPHPPGETGEVLVPTPATDDLAAEIQQIAAAERALARGEFRRALELAHEHASTHPRGQLVHERTAIALAARCQLGEPGAVEAAASFLREHGDAPAAAKVRARCGAPDSSIHE